MPDLGGPVGDAPVAHLATPQWQSFEVRMRARKAERCLQRAAAALDGGSLVEANDALDEARRLSPLHPQLQELTAKLDALNHPAPQPSARRHHAWTVAAVAAGLVLFSAAGWEAWLHRDQLTLVVPKTQPEAGTSAGLTTPTTANPSNTTSPPTRQSDATQSTSAADTVVQTTLVRPDLVIDTRAAPSEPGESDEPASVGTLGVKPTETTSDVSKALIAPKPPDTPTRAQPEIATASLGVDYRSPTVLPASPTPSPAATFIPSVVPPEEPPRPTSAATNTSTTNAPTPSAASDSVATATPPVNAPASSTSSAPAPGPSSSPLRDDRVSIRTALSRYESAYNRLDVDAVRSIWPTLDQRALARAFDSLTSQRVSLQNCDVDVTGSTARANCAGSASWTPKIGGGERTSARKWMFDLSEADGAWRIVHVQAR